MTSDSVISEHCTAESRLASRHKLLQRNGNCVLVQNTTFEYMQFVPFSISLLSIKGNGTSFVLIYMGHFINNAQGGKTAEWMMQSQ